MEVALTTGASLREAIIWPKIDWSKAYRTVRRLQVRIVKAIQAGKKAKVRALQNILARSLSAKAFFRQASSWAASSALKVAIPKLSASLPKSGFCRSEAISRLP